MGLIELTQIYKIKENIALAQLTGKIQRVVNESDIKSISVTFTDLKGVHEQRVNIGEYADFWFDGINWRVESTDSIPEGTKNLYFTESRGAAAAPVQSVAGRTGDIHLSISDISGLGSAALRDIPGAGNASAAEVVLGDDTRLVPANGLEGQILSKASGTDYDFKWSTPADLLNVGGDTKQKEIENLIVHWAMIDPDHLDPIYQVCDGSLWREGSYAKTYWDAKGVYNIPDMRGQFARGTALGDTDDPDRNERRQSVTGNVVVGTSVVITLPVYYINIIKEAIDHSRPVVIGQSPAAIFDALTVYGTVSVVDITLNTVTLTSVTGTFSAGSNKTLIIKGDVVGSFQNDEFKNHQHMIGSQTGGGGGNYNPAGHPNGTMYLPAGIYSNSWGATFSSWVGGNETRVKNIALLPIMMVDLPTAITAVKPTTVVISDTSYIKQIVQNHVKDAYTYSEPAARISAVEIACLTTSITLKADGSQVAIDMFINGEIHHDSVFILERVAGGVVTEIGSPSPIGSRANGIAGASYDPDNASTMNQNKIQYIDSPNVAQGSLITYRVKIHGTATTCYINRTVSDSDSLNYERGTSNVRLTEFGGVPILELNSDLCNESEARAGVINNKAITPYTLKQGLNADGSAPIYACRAWVNFNGAANVPGDSTKNVIRGSGNVSSITDNGTGDYTVNFITAMPDINYSVSGAVGSNTVNYTHMADIALSQTIGINSFRFDTGWGDVNSNGYNKYDCNIINIAVFR